MNRGLFGGVVLFWCAIAGAPAGAAGGCGWRAGGCGWRAGGGGGRQTRGGSGYTNGLQLGKFWAKGGCDE